MEHAGKGHSIHDEDHPGDRRSGKTSTYLPSFFEATVPSGPERHDDYTNMKKHVNSVLAKGDKPTTEQKIWAEIRTSPVRRAEPLWVFSQASVWTAGFLLTLVVGILTSPMLFKFIGFTTSMVVVCAALSALSLIVYHDGATILLHIMTKAKHCKELRTKPKRIIMIRHGESEGNVDHSVYCRVPDNKVPLSEHGKSQAEDTGRRMQRIIGEETVRFFVSPYKRSKETYEYIIKGLQISEDKYTWREDARLREQDWGNFQDFDAVQKQKEERKKFGAFYYRFPNGESGADVYDRVTSFWSSLTREWKYTHCLENFVIVSHGITCRMLLMRYFKWTVDEFEELWNFDNCQLAILQLQPSGKYALITPLKRTEKSPEEERARREECDRLRDTQCK